MKILLLSEVPKVGRKGEIVDVSEGFGKNVLLRRKVGQIATPQLIEQYESRIKKESAIREEKISEIGKLSGVVSGEVFEFEVKTGKNGEVFSSIHSDDIRNKILEFLHKNGGKALTLDDVHCDAKPIKILGEHNVAVKIGKGDYGKEIKVKIKLG